MPSVTIRPERAADRDAVRRLHDAAFGRRAEGVLVDALRAARCVEPDGSLVALRGDGVVGHVLFTTAHLSIDGTATRAAALAPLAVAPPAQRQGIGTALVREGLRRLQAGGVAVVVVLGDPAYYERFGFRVELGAKLRSSYAGPHFMALALEPGALADAREGEVAYAAPFADL